MQFLKGQLKTSKRLATEPSYRSGLIVYLLAESVANLFKSRRRLEGEILFLRHQLNIALRRRPARFPLRGSDRALLMWMTRLWPSLLGMARVVEPATILRWHRAGFRATGAGNRESGQGGRGLIARCVI